MKISLFVLAGMTRGSSAQWPLKSVHNDCSQFNQQQQCKSHPSCEWWSGYGYSYCDNKDSGATTTSSYVSLEASEDEDDDDCPYGGCSNVYDWDNGFEKGSKSYLRAGQVKK